MSRFAAPSVRRFSVRSAGDRVTRDQLIVWINARLESISVSFKVLGSGEGYCRLLCPLRTASLPLGKQGLDKACLHREFRIEVPIAGHFRDHYELLKWFKRLFDETDADNEQGQAERGDSRRMTLGPTPPASGPAAPSPLAAARRPSADPQDEVERINKLAKESDKYLSALRSIENLCRGRETKSAEGVSVVDKIIELLKPLQLHRPPALDCQYEN
ncbi:microtubule-associated protein RP/EB family member 1-like [Haemaphysalis longicornis]